VCAELVHRASARAHGPFLRVNCAAFAESLLDSELFGHVRGAFTGAVADKTGLLEAASGGTVLLDEIGDMPLATQVRLLRVLESKEVTRVGATKPRSIDIRVVAATHRDLAELITTGKFREDLYYRINGISIIVPPLRERANDIEPLARHFVARFAKRALGIAPDAAAWLHARAWPGNVRELRNAVERAVALCDGAELTAEHFAEDAAPARRASAASNEAPASLRDEVRGLERERIERALAAAGGNQSRAAEDLGISRGALLRRIAQLGIRRS
jgi:transcriptional regulator with PAS, ATPase and Fis domain